MRTVCLLLAGFLSLFASENPRDLVTGAIQNYRHDGLAAIDYTYTTTDTNPKGSEVTIVMPLEGTPFERLIERNGRPISAEEEQRQQSHYEEALRKRKNETPEEHEKRLRKFREQSAFLQDVPAAFDFTLLPGQVLNGRANHVVQCTPKPDYQGHDLKARMFSKLSAKIWIDRQDLRIARAEAEITGPLSIGWIMARIGKGGHIKLQQTRVAPDLWLPQSIDISGTARILLVDDKKIDEQLVFGNFKRVTPAPTGHMASRSTPATP